ncbi:MAG: DEAD/DEAH box helicase [Defluviicoccus sp.]
MRIHSFDDISRAVPAAAMDKGTAYQRRRRATVTEMADDGSVICGRVQGSQYRPYTVRITLATTPEGAVSIAGQCSCPVSFNCKHVAALLIESMATPAGRTRAPVATAPSAAPVLTPQTETWLADLDRALSLSADTYPPSVRQRLIYLLSLAEGDGGPAQLVLEQKSVRLRKDDSFGAVTACDLRVAASGTPPKYLREEDLRILARLPATGGTHGCRLQTLPGDSGTDVLTRVLETGRCRWRSVEGLVMRLGPPRAATFGWTMLADGGQRPQFAVAGGGTAVCLIPPWYVDAEDGLCGPLEIALAPRVAATLMQAPAIPPQHIALLRSRLTEKLPACEDVLPPEPAPPEVVKGPPVPVLRLIRRTLKPGYHGYASRYSTWGEELAPIELPVAQLAFAYGPHVLSGADRQRQRTIAREGRLFSIERDLTAEKKLRARLDAANARWVSIDEPYRAYALPADARGDLVLDSHDPMAWPRFLVEVAPVLRAEGWRIEVEPGFAPDIAQPDGDFDAIVEEGSGIDWFEFAIGIAVDGRRVNILPQIIELLKAVPADADSDFFDLAEADEGTLFVTLEDGRLLPLAYAKVKPILAALYELFRADIEVNGHKLGFSRAHAAELSALEERISGAGIRWTGGEALRTLGARLRTEARPFEHPVPAGFTATLRPYQRQGYGWLRFLGEAGLGGVLADDMGLGKTVQTLAHLLAEKEDGRADRPSLVVAPTSLMANWRLEAERFAPALKVLTLHGPERKAHFAAILGYDLVLSTYALLPRDRDVLAAQPWHALIVDEAQNVKNPETNAARVLRSLDARQRFCLTGTPVENHLGEMWALMDFLNPGFLSDRRHFARAFRTPIEKYDNADRRHALSRRLRPFLLRRLKAEVAAELPPKTEIIEHITMEPAQSAIYEAVRLTMHRKVRDAIAAKGLERSRIIILDALLKLRQVCCDPRLVKLASVKKAGAGSAKLARLMEMLDELVLEGRRVLVFSQFTSMLALIEERLTAAGITYAKITGEVRDRATPVRDFQKGKVPVFLISLKAGGTGLNLTAADTVILYDPWWNPAVEAQAIDRSHRIGQDKSVFVHRMVTEGSIEEKMLELQKRKGALAAGLYDPDVGGPLDITDADIELLLAGR